MSIEDDGQGRVVTLRQVGVYNPDTGALDINRVDGDTIRVTTNTPDGTVTRSVAP